VKEGCRRPAGHLTPSRRRRSVMRRPEMATAPRSDPVKCHLPERFHTVWDVCETGASSVFFDRARARP
jgi:hypothetical protein